MPAAPTPAPTAPPLPDWLAVCPAQGLGHAVVFAPAMDSTHARALALAEAGAAHGTLVTTDHQTDGRGRHRRAWLDAPGEALLVSLVLRPAPPPDAAARVPMAAAVALADVLVRRGLDVRLKWPNDVRAGGRKLAGVLATRSRSALVLSFGLNVNQHQFPPDLASLATSMAREAGHDFARGDVLAAFLAALPPCLALAEQAPEALLARYRAHLEGLGDPVEIRPHDGAAPLTGTFEDVTPDGGLRLRLGDGTTTTFYAGDVSLRQGR